MSDTVEARLAAMRREFDESFARAPELRVRDTEQFLAVRAGGGRYAIALAQVSLFAKASALTGLPAEAEGFLGLTAVRGGLVPVFGLAQLLGHPAGPAQWLVLTAQHVERGLPLAFAFADWDGYVREPREESARLSGTIRHLGQPYVILDLSHLIRTLRAKADSSLPSE